MECKGGVGREERISTRGRGRTAPDKAAHKPRADGNVLVHKYHVVKGSARLDDHAVRVNSPPLGTANEVEEVLRCAGARDTTKFVTFDRSMKSRGLLNHL